MKLVRVLLHPIALFLFAAGGVAAGFASHNEYWFWDKRGTDGLVLGLFVFAGVALLGAVIRLGQLRDAE